MRAINAQRLLTYHNKKASRYTATGFLYGVNLIELLPQHDGKYQRRHNGRVRLDDVLGGVLAQLATGLTLVNYTAEATAVADTEIKILNEEKL